MILNSYSKIQLNAVSIDKWVLFLPCQCGVRQAVRQGQPLSYWSSPHPGLSECLLNDWMNININPGHLGNVNLSSLRLWGNKVETLLVLQNQAFPCTRVRELQKEWSLEWENQWSVGEWLKHDGEFTPRQVGTGQTRVWFPSFAAYEQCELGKLA